MHRLNDWNISDDGISADDVLQNGNRLLTGNGYLGRRGVVDEAEASDMPATILSGIYDRHGDLWREPVNSPDPLYTLLIAEGAPLRAGDEHTVSHEQALDFRYGIYSRNTSWRVGEGTITVKAQRFAHIQDVHLLCMRYTISSDVPCALTVRQGINLRIKDLNGPHLGNFRLIKPTEQSRRVLGLSCATLEQRIPLSVFSVLVLSADGAAAQVKTIEGGDGIFTGFTIELDGKNDAGFFVYGSVYTGLDTGNDDPAPAAEEQVIMAANEGWDSLLRRHKAEWDKIWQKGDVIIEGDEYAQRCLRYSLYHLWIIAPRHCEGNINRALSIPARGLSGQTYKGAIFWDTEMFIAPYFLTVKPELAAQFIRYRIQTLPGAKRKAAEYGYRGAFFAWESQENGDDACSDFNVTDVFTGRPVRTYFRDKQVHISADIVYSIQKYIGFTGDFSILTEGGMELILEAARFFLSYLYYSPEHKRYEVLDVIGPDEYHERVHNNAFTNRIVFAVFVIARNYIEMFNKDDPLFINDLIKRIGFNEDLEFMKTVMGQFCLPRPNEQGVIEQFDGYFRLEDCSLETVKSRLKDPKEYWGGGGGVAAATRIIKQADVVTMLALFGADYPAEIKKANLDYYEPRTEHGSSLSSCMYALLSCETGSSEKAYPFFIKSAEIDITGKSKHFAGLVYIGGTHPAANGGAWLTAIHGFCGFYVEDGEIKLRPRLPPSWKKVKFSVTLRGIDYDVTVTKDDYSVCRKSKYPAAEQRGILFLKGIGLGFNTLVTAPEERGIKPSPRIKNTGALFGFDGVQIEGAIFDLDGVLVDTAKYHYLAWKRLAAELGFNFTEKDNERLKGVSRIRSLEILLETGRITMTARKKEEAAARKNAWYVEYLHSLDETALLPGVREYLLRLRENNILIALGSASKNTPLILERLNIAALFDAVIDGNVVSKAKPDPEVFLKGAAALGIAPEHCVVFEDALAGIEAARAGGMLAIGVGKPEHLPGADRYIATLADML